MSFLFSAKINVIKIIRDFSEKLEAREVPTGGDYKPMGPRTFSLIECKSLTEKLEMECCVVPPVIRKNHYSIYAVRTVKGKMLPLTFYTHWEAEGYAVAWAKESNQACTVVGLDPIVDVTTEVVVFTKDLKEDIKAVTIE